MLGDKKSAGVPVSVYFSDESVGYSVDPVLEFRQSGTEFLRQPWRELQKEAWPQYYQEDNDKLGNEYDETEDDKAVHRSAE